MARPKSPNPKIDVHLKVPPELYGRIQALLFSQTEGRVPVGAISTFFNQAAERHLDAIVAATKEA